MPLRNGGFVFYVDVWAFFNSLAVGLFELQNISQLVRGRTMCAPTGGMHSKCCCHIIKCSVGNGLDRSGTICQITLRFCECSIIFMPVRGVGDVAPYCKSKYNLNFIKCVINQSPRDDASIVPYKHF